MSPSPVTAVERPVATCSVFVPPHTVIGGSDVAGEAFKNFVGDMRAMTQAAEERSREWHDVAITNARRSGDFYSLVAFNAAVAGQTGDTSNQQTTSPRRTGAADTDSAGSSTANRSVDNATANGAQGGSAAIVGIMQQMVQALADNQSFIAQAMQTLQKLQVSTVSAAPNATAAAA